MKKQLMKQPVKKIKETREIKKVEQKLDKEAMIEEINLANIDSYDGTDLGQLEFPKEQEVRYEFRRIRKDRFMEFV